MIGLDTSVLVRYLVGTPPSEAARVTALIDGAGSIGLPAVALLEAAHVLRTQYGVARSDVLDALIEFVTSETVEVLGLPTPDALDALVRARSLPGSPLADALIAAMARVGGALPLYTFDEGLGRHGIEVAAP